MKWGWAAEGGKGTTWEVEVLAVEEGPAEALEVAVLAEQTFSSLLVLVVESAIGGGSRSKQTTMIVAGGVRCRRALKETRSRSEDETERTVRVSQILGLV